MELYEQTRQVYENTMSEWLAVEAIVRQRDKENTAASIAKLSSESTSGEGQAPPPLPRDLSNDVCNILKIYNTNFMNSKISGFRRYNRR